MNPLDGNYDALELELTNLSFASEAAEQFEPG